MSSNSTSGCSIQQPDGVILAFVGIPLSSLVICENLLGMITIWRSSTLHTNANRLIFSLAVADMNVGIAFFVGHVGNVISSPAVDTIYMSNFLFGFATGMFLLSCCHMGVIAIDRYIYIAHPFYYITNMTRRRILTITSCSWIAGVLLGLVPFVAYNDEKYHENCILTHPPIEIFAIMAVTYIITITIVFVTNFKIALLAYNRKIEMAARKIQTTGVDCPSALNLYNRTAIMKSVKFFLIMFGVFFICTGVAGILATITTSHQMSVFIHEAVMILFLVNSGINFIVYSHMNKDFSEAWKAMLSNLTQCCCKRRRSRQ